MGGVVGSFDLAGATLGPFWPVLLLGQWTHAGKGCSMGLGRYVLEPLGAEGVVPGRAESTGSVRPHPGTRGTPADFASGHGVRAIPAPSMVPRMRPAHPYTRRRSGVGEGSRGQEPGNQKGLGIEHDGAFTDCGANIGELGLWVRRRGLACIPFETVETDVFAESWVLSASRTVRPGHGSCTTCVHDRRLPDETTACRAAARRARGSCR